MPNKQPSANSARRALWIAVLILLVAGVWRITRVTYGVDDPCLAVPDEYWLYDDAQIASLYAWDVRPIDYETLYDPPPRTVATTRQDMLALRLGGALAGLLGVAILMRLGRDLGANGWALAGLGAAVLPWFVSVDRWIVRFDPAALLIAGGAWALVRLRRAEPDSRAFTAWTWLHAVAVVGLLLAAPPLWWLALALLMLHPHPRWRVVLFAALVGIISIPALHSPYHWVESAIRWDVGATAACAWGLAAVGLWRWRRLPALGQIALALAIMAGGALSLWFALRLPNPNADEWALVHWLHARVPDGSLVRFDQETWSLAPVVDCPMGVNLQIRTQPQPVNMVFLPGTRRVPAMPAIIVADDADTATAPFMTQVGPYVVGRTLDVPNPVDIPFGGVVYILGYNLTTPEVAPGQALDVRLDFQFADGITVDALRYAAFIHVTLPGQPGEKLVDYSLPLFEESGVFGPREVVINHHERIGLPADTPPGTYDVLLGFFNVYTGERLHWPGGDALVIGQVRVGGE